MLAALDRLDSWAAGAKPTLEVHYILYRDEPRGKAVFSSLHGDGEVQEDLIQIAIRDKSRAVTIDVPTRIQICENRCGFTSMRCP